MPAILAFYDDGGARSQHNLEVSYAGAKTRIEGLIQQLHEKRGDLSEPEAAPRMALAGRSVNPAIAAAAQGLYRDGHYSQAVFEAGKTLIDLVKRKSGRTDLDGTPLMQAVFSVGTPTLAFNDLSDQCPRVRPTLANGMTRFAGWNQQRQNCWRLDARFRSANSRTWEQGASPRATELQNLANLFQRKSESPDPF
jgi:hypothetical protein